MRLKYPEIAYDMFTLVLQNFYKTEINRQEMYIRYIYKLSNLHVEALNFTEAAFTLLLHAQLLDFSSDAMVPDDEMYPTMLEWQKKEVIYHQIINYFDVGKVWHCVFIVEVVYIVIWQDC